MMLMCDMLYGVYNNLNCLKLWNMILLSGWSLNGVRDNGGEEDEVVRKEGRSDQLKFWSVIAESQSSTD